jgi:hypothetical protein
MGKTGGMDFRGVKVFSATMAGDRERLGERIGKWLADNPGVQVVDKVVLQSSDAEFHCLSVTLFYRELGSPS